MNLQELIQRIRSWFYPVIDLGRVQQFKEVGIIPYFSYSYESKRVKSSCLYSYLKPKKEVEGYCSLLFPNLNNCQEVKNEMYI